MMLGWRVPWYGPTSSEHVKGNLGLTLKVQEIHLATVVETLQSIKQSDMSPMLSRIYGADGGPEILDVLMKYLCVLSSCPHP